MFTIPSKFKKQWLNRTKDKFMFGTSINDLDKDELLACLAFSMHKEKEQRERKEKRLL